MVYICPAVSYFCGAHIHTGKNRDRGRKLQSGDSDPDNGGRLHGLGDGISDKRPGRDLQHREKSWLFLILSGLATGASWLCYYKALQMGETSKVVPVDKLSVVITLVLAFIFLHEKFTPKSIAGCVLIGAGTLLMVL